jgi:hypothetical protein
VTPLSSVRVVLIFLRHIEYIFRDSSDSRVAMRFDAVRSSSITYKIIYWLTVWLYTWMTNSLLSIMPVFMILLLVKWSKNYLIFFIIGLFKDIFHSQTYDAWNDRTFCADNLESMWKDSVRTWCKIPSQHLSPGLKKVTKDRVGYPISVTEQSKPYPRTGITKYQIYKTRNYKNKSEGRKSKWTMASRSI